MRRAGFFRRLSALCRKETVQILRDPSSIVIAFVLPVVMLFIFGYGINLDSSSILIGLGNEDRGEESHRFVEALKGSPYLTIVKTGSRAELGEALKAGRIRGFVVLPSDFTQRLKRAGDTAPLQVVTDGSEPNTAAFVENFVRGAWMTWQQQRAADSGIKPRTGITVEPRFWFNPSAESRNYIVPGSITVIMTVIGALLTSLVIAREWERGTMEALLASPITRFELLLSKLLPYYALGMTSMLFCVMAAVGMLHTPFRGSLFALCLVSTFFLFSALGLGLLLSTITRNQFNAAQGALNAAFLPAVMLSGFVYEIRSMPQLVQVVTYFLPARYFVSAMQTMFQAGDLWPILRHDLFFLMASSVFFLGLTALKTRRRLD